MLFKRSNEFGIKTLAEEGKWRISAEKDTTGLADSSRVCRKTWVLSTILSIFLPVLACCYFTFSKLLVKFYACYCRYYNYNYSLGLIV